MREDIISSASTVRLVLQQRTYFTLFFVITILLDTLFYYGALFRGKNNFEASLLLIISLLIGIVITLQAFSLKNNVMKYREAGAGTFGTFLGVVTPLPLCCAPITLELLGLAAAAVFISQYGLLLMLVSILLLVVSVILGSKNIMKCNYDFGMVKRR